VSVNVSVKMSVTVSFFTTVVTEPGRVVIRVVPRMVIVVTDPESVTVFVILSVNVSVKMSVTVSFFTTVEPGIVVTEPGRVVIRVVPGRVTVVTDAERVTVLP